MTMALPLVAQAQEQTVNFNIPEQPLANALQAFGQQSGVQVLYSPDDIQGLRSTRLSGTLSAQEGLAKLLQNTGVNFSFQGNAASISRKSGDALELAASRPGRKH